MTELGSQLTYGGAAMGQLSIGRHRPASDEMLGPYPISAVSYDAATQVRQTGHSCIVQHFEMASDGCPEYSAVRAQQLRNS